MSPRRKSVDSSSSSSESDSDSSHKKNKKEKKEKKKDKHSSGNHDYGATSGIPLPQFPSHAPGMPQPSNSDAGHNHGFHSGGPDFARPPYAAPQPAPPPSGYRVPLSTTAAFPDPQQAGQPPFYDTDGVSPVFIGSALLERSVHPCKIGPHLQPFALVPYGGGEYSHHGRFDLLPFRHEQMEWVHTSRGRIPPGRQPIEGGYEEDGAKLYHAAAVVNGTKVPGKCSEHLNGCRVAFGGMEYEIGDNYEILCWR